MTRPAQAPSSAQGTLFAPPAAPPVPDLAGDDVILINISGGKDSQAALDETVRAADAAGVRDRIVTVFCDLGDEDEWPGTRELAAEHAAHYGLRHEEVRRQRAPVWQPVDVPRRKRPDVQRPVPPPTHQSRRQQRAAGPQFRTRLARRRRPVGAARGPAWPVHRRRRRLVEGRRRGPRGLRRAAEQPAQRNGQALIGTAGNTSRAHRARQRHPARRSARP